MDLQSVVGDIGRYTRDSILVTTTEATEAPSGPAIVWCNQAFTDMTGYRLEDIHGQTPRLLQGPDTPRKPLDRVRAALQAWQPVRTVVKNYTRLGAAFWAELSIVPVADDSGRYRYWLAVQRDVTDRVRQELHLKARYRKLHESELALQQERLQIGWDGIAAQRRRFGAASRWQGRAR
jgi:PAS domain S-box-containing protein